MSLAWLPHAQQLGGCRRPRVLGLLPAARRRTTPQTCTRRWQHCFATAIITPALRSKSSTAKRAGARRRPGMLLQALGPSSSAVVAAAARSATAAGAASASATAALLSQHGSIAGAVLSGPQAWPVQRGFAAAAAAPRGHLLVRGVHSALALSSSPAMPRPRALLASHCYACLAVAPPCRPKSAPPFDAGRPLPPRCLVHPPPPPRGQQEVREYTLKPEGVRDYLRLTAEHADLRKQLLPFLGCAAKGKE
jgi:hypothetical protein